MTHELYDCKIEAFLKLFITFLKSLEPYLECLIFSQPERNFTLVRRAVKVHSSVSIFLLTEIYAQRL